MQLHLHPVWLYCLHLVFLHLSLSLSLYLSLCLSDFHWTLTQNRSQPRTERVNFLVLIQIKKESVHTFVVSNRITHRSLENRIRSSSIKYVSHHFSAVTRGHIWYTTRRDWIKEDRWDLAEVYALLSTLNSSVSSVWVGCFQRLFLIYLRSDFCGQWTFLISFIDEVNTTDLQLQYETSGLLNSGNIWFIWQPEDVLTSYEEPPSSLLFIVSDY